MNKTFVTLAVCGTLAVAAAADGAKKSAAPKAPAAPKVMVECGYVFEAENINLPVDFSEGKNTELKITYYLPIDIGNEAKNAEAIFELRFESSNE